MSQHFMLDLETLDTSPTAVVTTVGIVEFDPYSDRIGEKLQLVLNDWDDQQKLGRTVSANTFKWWLQQDAAAQAALLTKGGWSTREALKQIEALLTVEKNPIVWGNGADFDNIILGGLFESYGMKKPWSYGNNRCYRTMRTVFSEGAPKRQRLGTAHVAVDDALTQAVHLQELFAWLKSQQTQ